MYLYSKIISHTKKDRLKNIFRQPWKILKEIFQIKKLLKTYAELSINETLLREIIDNAKNAFAIYRAVDKGENFIIVNFNKSAEQIESVQRKEVIGKLVTEVFPGATEFGILEVFKRVYRTGQAEVHPVGIYKDERVQGWRDNYIFKLSTGEIVAAYTDETEKMQDKENLQRLNRHLKMLSDCNAALVKINNFRQLLNEVCEIIVDEGKYRLAWIGIARDDEEKNVYQIAQAGYSPDYLDNIKVSWADNAYGQGPSGKAIRLKQTIAIDSIKDNVDFEPWRAAALQYGYASSCSVPIIIDGKAVAIIGVYSTEERAFSANEVNILEQLANNLSYAIKSYSVQRQKEEATQNLYLSEQRFKELSELLPITVFESDLDGKLIYANKFGLESFQLTDEIIKQGFHIFELLISQDQDKARENFLKVLGAEYSVLNEYTAKRKDGSSFPALVRSSPIINNQGKIMGIRGVVLDYTQQKLYEQKIEKSLREKEVLLREIHHRVKNNMQIVNSLLNLEAGNVDDEKTKMILKEIQNRIMTMALLHETLYKTEDYSTINLSQYIVNIISHLKNYYDYLLQQIDLMMVIEDEVELDISKVIPCGLIINELLTNAFKYAFPENRTGQIKVILKAEGDQIVMRLEDDGIGFDKETALNAPKSLGLKLVQALTMQLSGELILKPAAGNNIIEVRFKPV